MKYGIQFLLMVICLNTTLQAQRPYQPMVVEGATWVEKRVTADFGIPIYLVFKIHGDTILSNTVYKKLYMTQATFKRSQGVFIKNDTARHIMAFMREDSITRKVFGITYYTACYPGDEFLMYDFSIGKGDSFRSCLTFEGDFTDSIKSIRRITRQQNPGDFLWSITTSSLLDSLLKIEIANALTFPRTYYEKIGHKEGILGGHPSYVPGSVVRLLNGGMLYYCFDSASCGSLIVTNIDDQPEFAGVSVFPNPTVSGSIISIKANSPSTQIKRVNMTGLDGLTFSLNKSTHINQSDNYHIPGNVAAGIYLLRLEIENQGILHPAFQKILIHK